MCATQVSENKKMQSLDGSHNYIFFSSVFLSFFSFSFSILFLHRFNLFSMVIFFPFTFLFAHYFSPFFSNQADETEKRHLYFSVVIHLCFSYYRCMLRSVAYLVIGFRSIRTVFDYTMHYTSEQSTSFSNMCPWI